MDSEISFCFLNDSKGETFLLDPPTMNLKPSEQQVTIYVLFMLTKIDIRLED